jgi:hypothetical protein
LGNAATLGSGGGYKINYLESKLREHHYDIVAITETGFTKNGMVALEGYKKIASNSRLRENGSTVLQAGTAVRRKDDSDLIINYADEINVEECQVVQIGTNQGYSIIVIYRSPNQTKKGIKISLNMFIN